MKNIHIVNGNSGAATLKYVLKKAGTQNTNIVYCFNDILSVGPLFQVESDIGQQKRKTYLSNLIHKIDATYPLIEIINDIPEFLNFNFSDFDTVTIWHGNNTPERILKFFCCKIIDDKNLYEIDISKSGERTSCSMGECSPESVRILLNSSKKISQEDYIKSREEWNQITLSESKLRVYRKEKIESVFENFYDQLILEQCTTEFTPAQKVIGITLGKSGQLIGDTFITNRLLFLIEHQQLQYFGDLNNIMSLLVKNNNIK